MLRVEVVEKLIYIAWCSWRLLEDIAMVMYELNGSRGESDQSDPLRCLP